MLSADLGHVILTLSGKAIRSDKEEVRVIVGVDTHADTHHIAAHSRCYRARLAPRGPEFVAT